MLKSDNRYERGAYQFMREALDHTFKSLAKEREMQPNTHISGRELLDGVVRLLNEAGVAEAVQQPGALHYLGEVVYAQGITRAFQDGFWILAIVYLLAVIPAWILSQTRRR